MAFKILTKNSIDNTNIDGARQNHFSAGMRSGIVRGAFNEGRFFSSASNVIALDSCELRISGHQVIIDSLEAITLSDRPSTPTKYSMIAEIQVSDMSVPSFRLFIQPASVDLRQENLFKTNNGSGTYQLRIGNFTLGTTGLISDVIRTADVITGGGDGGSVADIVFNATATQLSSSSQPEVNADYNEETKEWDLHFGIPAGGGTNVTIGGVVQPTWSADFAESERQKSKNLCQNTLENFVLSSDVVYEITIYKKTRDVKYPLCLTTNVIGWTYPSHTDSAFYQFNYTDGTVGYVTGMPLDQKNFEITFGGDKDLDEIILLNWSGINGTIEYVQLEENDHFTGYQPYNGAIVHEKDLEPELLYDNDTKQTIGGMTYPNGIGDGNVSTYIINNIDLTPYKYMYVYQRMYGEVQKIFVDLTKSVEAGGYCGGQSTLSYNIDALDCSLVKVPTTKDSITFDVRYIRLSDVSIQGTPVNVRRIEVYK